MAKYMFWHFFYWTSVLVGVQGFTIMFLTDPKHTWPGLVITVGGLLMFALWNVADYKGWTENKWKKTRD